MNNFTTKDMSDMLYEDLSMIEDIEGIKTDVVLAQPSTDSVYPCRVIDVPLESTMLTQNATPIRKTFQVTIEHWADKERFLMDMVSRTDEVLQKRNFVRTTSQPIIYDDITKKYRFIITYEVRYNAIANSLQFIR